MATSARPAAHDPRGSPSLPRRPPVNEKAPSAMPVLTDPLGEGRHRNLVSPKIEGELFVAGRRVPGQEAFDLAGAVTDGKARRTQGQSSAGDEGGDHRVVDGGRSPA